MDINNDEKNITSSYVNDKLPVSLTTSLYNYGIRKADVIYSVQTDMNNEGVYTDGFVLLTKTKLILAYAPPIQNSIHSFAGYKKQINNSSQTFSIHILESSKIDTLVLQRNVSTGCLYAHMDNHDVILSTFSNSFIGEFNELIKLFQKIKDGKELANEDFEVNNKHACCPKCGSLYPDQERKICPKCMDKRSIFLRTLSYFTPYKFKLFIMMLCYIATAALNLVWPYLNGTILYDKVLKKNELFLKIFHLPIGRFGLALVFVVITMLLTKVTMQLLGIIQGTLTATIVPDVVNKIKSQVFRSMGKLSISFYNSRQTGGLMTRVLDDANEVTYFFIDGLPYFFINVLTIILTCIVMISMNWKLAIASLILLPFLTLISWRLLPRLWSFYGRRHRASRSLNGQINDNITGARVVKAFGQEDSEMTRFSKYNEKVRKSELALVSFDNRFYALYSTVENIASFVVWGFGSAILLSSTNMELGILITFVAYVGQLNGPLDFLSYIFRWWANSINSAQRIFEIIDAVPEIQEKPNPIKLENLKGDITLNKVTFGYEPNKPILKDISFEVKAGEMLGVVGRSGAGKSTLVNLISRLYDPQEGEILMDGVPIKDMAFDDLRKNIAMVSQETYIFMGTVAQNIAYARPDASMHEIISAAVLASAHDFICKMPDGYDTIIGSSGRSLSGGERQRISIARAILADPKILILDEATASVDTETEQAIQKSLNMLVKGRTTLSIAHRLSTLKNADKLVVIDDGKLTESGTHDELIEQKGTYYKLMELQSKALALRGLD